MAHHGWARGRLRVVVILHEGPEDPPQLASALDLAARRQAALVIDRLDRLARDVAFIANLMDSRVEFVACDMPRATRLTPHILAAVAEHEREAISQHTQKFYGEMCVVGQQRGPYLYRRA